MSVSDRTVELVKQLVERKKDLVDVLIAKGEEAAHDDSFDSIIQKVSDYVPKSYILVDEGGNEIAAVLVDKVTAFDATVNDVREGKTFATDTGAKTGEKMIPTYVTHEGYRFATSSSDFSIPLPDLNTYDFTRLQVIICPYGTSISDSVAAEKIVINDSVYAVNSTEVISTVTRNSVTKTIELGITNESDSLYLIRYITYKEIY